MNRASTSEPDIWFQKDDIRFDHGSLAGEGGFGVVHVGRHIQYGKVALKRLGKWGDVQQEVMIWKRLHHVNVLPFLGVLGERAHIYIVSPWVENGSLRAYLSYNPEADRVRLMKDVAEGLAYLHENKVVHGDIKGPNILISGNIRAMLCDFGLSKQMDYTAGETRDAVGTLRWMSPERMLGVGPGRSFEDDVYAFGITIYEALSGQTPFSQYGSFSEIVQAVCVRHERPDRIPEMSPIGRPYDAIWMIASLCWLHEPNDRPTMQRILFEECFADLTPNIVEGQVMISAPAQGTTPLDSVKQGRKRPFRQLTGEQNLAEKFPRVENDHARDNHRLRELLRPVKTASYDADREVHIATCTPGTRTEVLGIIQEWILRDKYSSVFCINGMAGLGKSTIAKTIAEWAVHRRQYDVTFLLATFFFSRREGAELRTASLVLPTLAYELARQNVVFKDQVIALLDDDPEWAASPLSLQAKKLSTALQDFQRTESEEDYQPPLVVLDAFDECNSPASLTLLSLLLSMAFPPPSEKAIPLKILITSRPEIQLVSILNRYCQRRELVLHDMDKLLVQSDIRLYLEDAFHRVPEILAMPDLPRNWFQTGDLDALADRAGAFFIYASTALRIIQDETVRNPEAQLKMLLDLRTSNSMKYSELDHLYLGVLLQITKCTNPQLAREQFKSVVGPLVFLRDKLSINALGRLLRMESSRIFATLVPLQSLVTIRDCLKNPPDLDQMPTFYHASFYDFITSERCGDASLRLNSEELEKSLAIHCLEVMIRDLKQDIAGIKDPSVDIATLPDIAACISEELRYAVSYWALHLRQSSGDQSMLVLLLDRFASRCLLWWIEVCSVLGALDVASQSIRDFLMWKGSASCKSECRSLMNDAHRLIMAHGSTLRTNPLQIYTSILATVPTGTSLARKYQTKQNSLIVRVGRDQVWARHLAEWTGHTDHVTSVASSSDGAQVASGSNDLTIRIWDTASGTCIIQLKGHNQPITSVTFSPDGTRVASAASDEIRIWDVASGTTTLCFNPRYPPARFGTFIVAFSPDGTQVVSASEGVAVWIWDMASGTCTGRLNGHRDKIKSLTFSPDGTCVASASCDGDIRIWDVKSEKCSAILQQETAVVWSYGYARISPKLTFSLAFSPEGSQLASASGLHTVGIWDMTSKACVVVLKGHVNAVTSVVFSYDGKMVISSCREAVRVWDTALWTCTAILEGKSQNITSVAFLPDNVRVAYGSEDQAIRLWDISSQTDVVPVEGHTKKVKSLVFSSDGSRVLSSCEDTIHIWDNANSACFSALKIPALGVSSFALSPNGAQAVFGSRDRFVVRVWNVRPAKCIATLRGHTQEVNSVSISLKGTLVASGSNDCTVRVWHVGTRICVANLKGHTDRIYSAAFSIDETLVVSGSGDGTARVWDVALRTCIAILKDYTSIADSLAFSLDGNRVISFQCYHPTREWSIHIDRSKSRRQSMGVIDVEPHPFEKTFRAAQVEATWIPGSSQITSDSQLEGTGSGIGDIQLVMLP